MQTRQIGDSVTSPGHKREKKTDRKWLAAVCKSGCLLEQGYAIFKTTQDRKVEDEDFAANPALVQTH